MSYKVRPRDGNIVYRIQKEEKRGSLHLPGTLKDTTAKKRNYGVIVAVGPGELKEDRVSRWPMPFKVGDLILPDTSAPIFESHHEDGDTLYIQRAVDVVAELERLTPMWEDETSSDESPSVMS